MWRYLVVLVLLAHGVGHVMGFLAAWTTVPMGFTQRPWLLSDGVLVQSGVGRAFGLLWLVALLGFVGAALGLLTHQAWWQSLALAAAVVSLVAILPWWNTVTAGARFGAVVFDLLVIAGLLLWRAPITEAIG